MNGLSDQFSDQIDFFYIDIDQSESADVMQQINVRGRSTYVLLGSNGEELQRWAGPLDLDAVSAQISSQLDG